MTTRHHAPTPDQDHNGQHGVAIKVADTGILITGKPGIGKSSLALELLHHGHQLVADDHIQFSVLGNQLIAHCPTTISGMLHSRELGMIDVREMFPDNAWLAQMAVDMMIHLQDKPPSEVLFDGSWQLSQIMNIQIPTVTLTMHSTASLHSRLSTAVKMLACRRSELMSSATPG